MDSQLKLLRETVRENQMRANEQTSTAYDTKFGTKLPTFTVSDRVWLHEPVPSKVKLGHKIAKKFQGPYLILESFPEYHVYKLQNCSTKKILPSLIHANRLRLCNTTCDAFYSKNNTTAGTGTAAVSADGCTLAVSAAAASSGGEPTAGAPGAAPDHAVTATAAAAATQPSADPAQAASSMPSTSNVNSSQQASHGLVAGTTDWYTIKYVKAHRRRGRIMYYQVCWSDDTLSWVSQRNLSDAAIDSYWLAKNQRRTTHRTTRVFRRRLAGGQNV